MTNQTINTKDSYYQDRPRRSYNDRRKGTRITNIIKSFGTFSTGYQELIRFLPEVKDFGGDVATYDAVVAGILSKVANNVPSTNNPNYPNTYSLSIDSHEVGFRTDARLAIGWRTSFDRDAGEVVYKFRISFLSVNAHRRSIIDEMKGAGWEVTEQVLGGERSRFWNSLSNNRRNRYENNKETNTEQVEEKENTEVNETMKDAFKDAGYDVEEKKEFSAEINADVAVEKTEEVNE